MKKSIRIILAGTVCVAGAAVVIGGGTLIGSAKKAEKNSIGSEAAVSAAFKDAGLNKENVLRTRSNFERENGKYVFEVEFDADGKEYDYVVDAQSGEVIERKIEKDDDIKPEKTTAAEIKTQTETTQPAAKQSMDVEKAKQIALADADVKAEDAKFIKAKADYDDDVKVFDIEFVSGSKEYEYEIHAETGKIIDKDMEAVRTQPKTVKQSTTAAKSDLIGVDSAKQKTLSHAGLSSADVRFTKVKLDKEHGINVYEIEFVSGRYAYEYEINASTGKIVEWDKEIDD